MTDIRKTARDYAQKNWNINLNNIDLFSKAEKKLHAFVERSIFELSIRHNLNPRNTRKFLDEIQPEIIRNNLVLILECHNMGKLQDTADDRPITEVFSTGILTKLVQDIWKQYYP